MSETKLGTIVAHPCETCRDMVQCVGNDDGSITHIDPNNYPEKHACAPKHEACPVVNNGGK